MIDCRYLTPLKSAEVDRALSAPQSLRAASQSQRRSAAFNGKNGNRVSGMFRARVADNWEKRAFEAELNRIAKANPSASNR
jgi:hypothetical protein